MKRIVLIVGALSLLAALPASAAEWGKYGMIGLRIAVKDYDKSMDFYKKLGMKVGRRYHPEQQEMTWGDPSQGPNIVLVHDESGKSKLMPGTASLMMQVPDVAAFAATLKSSGYPDVGAPKGTDQYQVLLIKDPDGNQIEVLGPAPKK